MSALKLQDIIFSHCCRRWSTLLRIGEAADHPGCRSALSSFHTSRHHSTLVRHSCQAVHLTSSSHAPNPSSRHRFPSAWTLLYTRYVPCPLSVLQNAPYSTSPQPRQKDEPGGVKGEGKDRSVNSSPEQSQDETTAAIDKQEEPPKGILARFKDAYKNYGKVLIGVHCVTSAFWFGGFYYTAYTGIDVVPLLKWLGASDKFISPFQSSGIGNVAVAYLLYKIATPARYTVTILGTRESVKYLRKVGFMEQVPQGDSIRDLMKESREQVIEKYQDLKDEVKDRREEYKDKLEEKKDELKEKFEEKRDEFKDRLKK